MTVAAITQIAYAVQNLFDPAGTVGRLVDLGKLANYGLLGTKWSPALLFLAGEQGVWYDPSDIKLNWRRNLLTYSEQFDNAVWLRTANTISPNSTVAPDGTMTADKLVENTATNTHEVRQDVATAAAPYVFSAYVKAAGRNFAMLYHGQTGAAQVVNLTTGELSGNAGLGAPTSATTSNEGNGWFRVSITITATAASNNFRVYPLLDAITYNYTGDGTSGIYIWGAQLEQGSTATEYQRITDGIQDYLTYQPMPVLYQDAAGTTPVTAVEQPVGLMLDKSKGLVLGPELVTNGDFSNGSTGWTLGNASWSVSGGKASNDGTNGVFASLVQSSAITAGKFYVVEWDQTITSGSVNLWFAGTQSIASVVSGSGRKSYKVRAAVSGSLFFEASIGGVLSLDNISVRELPGNHAYQTVSTKRPVLSARVNLLTKTEQFDDTVWVKQAGTSVSATKVAAPDGTLTAFSVTGDGVSGLYQIVPGTNSLGQSTRSIYLRVQAGTATVVIKDPVLTQGTTTCNLTTLWKRFTLSETTSPTGGNAAGIWVSNIPVTGIEVAWPDLRVTNTGVNLPAYQKVNTATDYDTQGFPLYLKFDSIDDSMQTNSIDFTATDKMTVWAGVRKLSDATAFGVVAELSAAMPLETGAFAFYAPGSTAGTYAFGVKGSAQSWGDIPGNSAPISNVLSFATSTNAANRAGMIAARNNGSVATLSGGSDLSSTGNYGNYPLYIGARAGTSLFFNGNLYSLIVRGAQSSAAQIESTEQWVNGKTAAF